MTPGQQYDLSVWYKSTTPDASMTLFRHDTTAGWQYWTDLATLPTSAGTPRRRSARPPVPANTDQITWGVSVYGVGTLTTDDYAMEEVADPAGRPDCTGSAGAVRQGQVGGHAAQTRSAACTPWCCNNGKVLLIAGSGNDTDAVRRGHLHVRRLRPGERHVHQRPDPDDLFCSGPRPLQDGRVLVMGGNKDYPAADGTIGYKG